MINWRNTEEPWRKILLPPSIVPATERSRISDRFPANVKAAAMKKRYFQTNSIGLTSAALAGSKSTLLSARLKAKAKVSPHAEGKA